MTTKRMENAVSSLVQFKERDIVVVTLLGDLSQAFYRSTGKSSAMPGVWLPFDGVADWGWFIKDRFRVRDENNNRTELNRFGNVLFKTISDKLGSLNIPTASTIFQTPAELNTWLRLHNCLIPR
jgi:hypothetical protein